MISLNKNMLNLEKHKNILIKILKDIYTDNSLGPLLGFKGGTAALLFYGLPRFSVDLDFDLLDLQQEDYVFKRIGQIIANYGEIKDQRKKYYTLFYELTYSLEDQNVKVEINRRDFGSKYQIINYFGISMQVMLKADIFANKLAAFYERVERANRDIFDVWFFLEKGWPLNKDLIEKRLGLSLKEILIKCISKLEKVPSRNILAGLGEILNEKQKFWIKTKLKSETLFLLKVFLDAQNIKKSLN